MIPPLKELTTGIAQNLRGLFFDLDDTFTENGKIPLKAFQALWSLKEHGLKAVVITGRPAGWCDHIARMWPVDGVVGENGAFYFWYDEKSYRLQKRFLAAEAERRNQRERLAAIGAEILAAVPGTALASDQLYRESDLAIDYCEDVPPLDQARVEKICRIFRAHGATCKVSSIHVNGWFGDYDKLQMTQRFVQERWDLDLNETKARFIFCGDSPNDEPLFQYFPYSVGVKNVLRFSDQMRYRPAFVADSAGGEGFAEIVAHILRQRQLVQ